MEIRIGVMYAPREIVIELADDQAADAVRKDVDAAVDGGGVLWVEDKRGRKVGIPAERLAYVEFGSPEDHRVGFGV